MAAAALSFSFPGDRVAPPRFALALAASACAHLFLVQTLVFDLPQRAGRPVHAWTMAVRIAPPAAPVAAASEPLPVAPRTEPGAAAADRNLRIAPMAAGAHPQQRPVTPPALPQAPDPMVYSARDLDVYPRPAVALDFDRLGSRVTGGAAGRVKVLLLIDEGGTVNEITIVEAEPPGPLREALRAALAATRFFPGQKDGRAVKSRVLLSVSFDSARAESAGNR